MVAVWKELGFRSYDGYIRSRLWWSIRQIILERDGRCCQICGNPSKTVHHIDYTRVIMLGQGDQHELITLCEQHHNFVEQSKRLSEKRTLLHQLFTQYTQNTLDEWQIWAKTFNIDIGYSCDRILEPKSNRKKKHKKKKNKQKISIISDTIQPSTQIEKPKSELQSLRDDIDSYIKAHKKPSKKDLTHYLNSKDHKWINNKIKYYNKLHEKTIREQLSQAFPYFINMLINHKDCSKKLKDILNSLIQKNNKQTLNEKRKRKEEQYQRQREKKKTKIMGKLPNWTTNHKAKSFQGESPLIKYVQKPKQDETKETGLDKPITLM